MKQGHQQPSPAQSLPLQWQDRVAEFVAHAGPLASAGTQQQNLTKRQQRQATKAELAAVARILNIEHCQSLSVDYTLRPLHKGRFAFSGRLYAQVVQLCVVSLAEVEQTVEEDFDFEFWPTAQIEQAAELPGSSVEEAPYLDPDAPDIEPIRDGVLDVGRLIYEVLASSLDPYPRAPDATVEGMTASGPAEVTSALGGAQDARVNPFAALAKLKGKL